MYQVSEKLSSSYVMDLDGGRDRGTTKSKPDMPQVVPGDRRMTNISLGNGEYICGIRKNADLSDRHGGTGAPPAPPQTAAHQPEDPPPAGKPLRYTPGLVCDQHLENLRPVRSAKHQTFKGGAPRAARVRGAESEKPSGTEVWSGGLATPTSRSSALPGLQYSQGSFDPYQQLYPQDELSRIKQRNQRFHQSCAHELVHGSSPYVPYGPPVMYSPGPMMPMAPLRTTMPGMMVPMVSMAPHQPYGHSWPGPYQPPAAEPAVMSSPIAEELSILEHGLNVTRRAASRYVSEGTLGGTDTKGTTGGPASRSEVLHQQRQALEEPLKSTLPNSTMLSNSTPTSVDQLAKPKRSSRTAAAAAAEVPKPKQEVKVADQIAIRSILLGQSIPASSKAGSQSNGEEEC